ncbi:MAG: alkaline phosphatase [Rikenellaceae bacterium]|jgi:alkaline phosphatase|nr:alkaline phosphatase [Rikenellaceae bacterium]
MRRFVILLWVLFALSPAISATGEVRLHSHNDYLQAAPFYQAYAQRFASIEADVFATGTPGELLVAHEEGQLSSAPSLDEAYIEPLARAYRQNGGRAWKGSPLSPILLLDLKTPAIPTLESIVEKLGRYPEVFDPRANPFAVRVVVSGNTPPPERFADYPAFIAFDGRLLNYTPEQLQRVAMISLNLRDYTQWNGKGSMTEVDRREVVGAIAAVHALGKPVRFWGTPDGVTAWNTFHNLGVDYINTDQVEACAAFFRNFRNKNYRMGVQQSGDGSTARAKRLDKATAGFSGFRNDELQLSQPVEPYTPTFLNDGARKRVRNVILLIGDGMGLAQVCAANTVNGGLSLLKIKHIGLQETQAADAYTTDSAAAGSALATGRKHHNRHISMGPDGEVYPSMTDLFHADGRACGVATLGNIADATPAAFYGHSRERDNAEEIMSWLRDGKLTLLCGSGMRSLFEQNDGFGYPSVSRVEDINRAGGKVVCIDERMDEAASPQTLTLLADATREAISKLSSQGKAGFFLMVEGAKIDYAGHANSLHGSIVETLSFDLAVREALKFADSNGETLVVVTGDHETGGLTLVDGSDGEHSITAHYLTDDHTPIMLPVYAYGPAAADFTGVYQNTEIFHRIINAAGIKKVKK